jgi:hypothetical protein
MQKHGDFELRNIRPLFMDVPQLELAIAAGLMEGEGCIRISAFTRTNKGSLSASLTNTNKEIVDWMHTRWHGFCKPVSGMGPNRKPAWAWSIAARKALQFLDLIEPYVITERMRDRIKTARWWQQIKAKPAHLRTEEDAHESFDCWHIMSHLNRRGIQP